MTISDRHSMPARHAAPLLREIDEDGDSSEEAATLSVGAAELAQDRTIMSRSGHVLTADFAGTLLLPEYVEIFLKHRTDVHWQKKTGSTNEDAKKAWSDGLRRPAIFIAESQTDGKGRLGRVWSTGDGSSVEMSILLPAEAPGGVSSGLSLAAGLGVQRGIQLATGLDVGIKWPNDIVARGKKLAGILVETALSGGRLRYIVIGIGVNVNQESFPEPLKDTATSVRMMTGTSAARARICAAVADSTIDCVRAFLSGDRGRLMKEYQQVSAVMGRDVMVLSSGTSTCGRCVGFTETGEIRISDGEDVRSYAASEISIRGASSYV